MKKLIVICAAVVAFSGCATSEFISGMANEAGEVHLFLSGMNDHIYGVSYSITKEVKEGKDPDLYVLNQCVKALEANPSYEVAINFMKYHLSRIVEHTKLAIWNNENLTAMDLKNQAYLYKYDNSLGYYEYMIKYKAALAGINKKLEELGITDPETGELFQLSIDIDYDKQLAEAKANCAETHYVVADRNDDKLLRKNRFKAIGDFEKALAFVPGYKDAEEKLESVKKTTMLQFVFGGVANCESSYGIESEAVVKSMKNSFPGYFEVNYTNDGAGSGIGYQNYLRDNEFDIIAVADEVVGKYSVFGPEETKYSVYQWIDIKNNKEVSASSASSIASSAYRKIAAKREKAYAGDLAKAKQECVNRANARLEQSTGASNTYKSFDSLILDSDKSYYYSIYDSKVANPAKSIVGKEYLNVKVKGSVSKFLYKATLKTDIKVVLGYITDKGKYKQKKRSADVATETFYVCAQDKSNCWTSSVSTLGSVEELLSEDAVENYYKLSKIMGKPLHSAENPQLKTKAQMSKEQNGQLITVMSEKIQDLIKFYFAF